MITSVSGLALSMSLGPERQLVHDPAEHREAAHRALRDELALAQPEL